MPEQHPSVPFDVALRGYDRDQVDAHLASLDSEFSSVLSERDRLATQVRQLKGRVEELHLQPGGPDGVGSEHATGSSLDGFGARVEKILRIAEDEAAEVREETRAQVERERQDAAKKIGEIREAAERDASLHRRKIEQEANQLLDKARQEAARVRAEAEAHAGSTREEASGHLEAVRARAAQAAADFETALAKRRQKAEADHSVRTEAAERELAETVARTDQLRAEAEKTRADAERRSQEMLQAAQRESGELVAEARGQADRTRRESERELSSLSKRRDAITDQLRNVREMLSTLTGGVVPSDEPEAAESDTKSDVPAPRRQNNGPTRPAAEARRS
jgi:cell division septum initiation protein DivIVA